MNDEAIKKVLSAPVNLLRPSIEEEKQLLFPNHKGYFYTIGLASGQSFVAHIPGSQEEEEDPFSLDNFSFRLRPVNNLIPQLREVKWVFTGSYGGPGINTHCQLSPETTEKERLFFEKLLGPKEERSPYGKRAYHPHEMFTKLNEVHNQLLENNRLKLALMVGQERLHDLMILNDKNLTNQTTQYIMNERRQKNG